MASRTAELSSTTWTVVRPPRDFLFTHLPGVFLLRSQCLGGEDRYGEAECRPAMGVLGQPHPAAMGFDDALTDTQPDPEPFGLGGHEGFEQALAHLRRTTG